MRHDLCCLNDDTAKSSSKGQGAYILPTRYDPGIDNTLKSGEPSTASIHSSGEYLISYMSALSKIAIWVRLIELDAIGQSALSRKVESQIGV